MKRGMLGRKNSQYHLTDYARKIEYYVRRRHPGNQSIMLKVMFAGAGFYAPSSAGRDENDVFR